MWADQKCIYLVSCFLSDSAGDVLAAQYCETEAANVRKPVQYFLKGEP